MQTTQKATEQCVLKSVCFFLLWHKKNSFSFLSNFTLCSYTEYWINYQMQPHMKFRFFRVRISRWPEYCPISTSIISWPFHTWQSIYLLTFHPGWPTMQKLPNKLIHCIIKSHAECAWNISHWTLTQTTTNRSSWCKKFWPMKTIN